MKINYDGALFGESDFAGLGVAIRNSNGKVLAALSEKILKPHSAELVEILAARRAVMFSRDLGFQNPVFEGDSSLVVKLLQDRCVSL
ncbi:reverse transcriptase-like protein, partial [Pseudoalteromonas sp. BMB]|uniref:reverse transcriptase-like protein n=1 Tax=Pseudoalteromonas sp. BMB TaxID=1874619 RepID=UPI001112DA67